MSNGSSSVERLERFRVLPLDYSCLISIITSPLIFIILYREDPS
jgi:hypothetical protein